jgi:hypothetical protein
MFFGCGCCKVLEFAKKSRAWIHSMKKIFAAVLLGMLFVSSSFAAKAPRQHKQKYDYRYHTPKYKVPKNHTHHSHPHKVRQSKAK